eukprot:Gb_13291 [translate_table: standard]
MGGDNLHSDSGNFNNGDTLNNDNSNFHNSGDNFNQSGSCSNSGNFHNSSGNLNSGGSNFNNHCRNNHYNNGIQGYMPGGGCQNCPRGGSRGLVPIYVTTNNSLSHLVYKGYSDLAEHLVLFLNNIA